MLVIWNAGAALAVTGLLTTLACFGVAQGHPARAVGLPLLVAVPNVDMPHRHYSGIPEHFEAANTSHDGRLTPVQARQAGWARVVRHFDEIDTDHAGFVTEIQVHAYTAGHRHSRKTLPGHA